jgi:alkaline phosphatase D
MGSWLPTAIVAAFVLAAPVVAASPPCSVELGRTIERYVTGKQRALARCEDARSRGDLTADVNCRPADGPVTDPATAEALAVLAARVAPAIVRCGPLPPLGVACDAATDAATLAACVTAPTQEPDTVSTSPDQLIDAVYATPVPIADATVRRCQATIGAQGGRYLGARLRAHRRCRLAGAAICPDTEAAARMARARTRLGRRVRAACPEEVLATLRFGPPCDLYRAASYTRSTNPLTPNANTIPPLERLIGCLADAHAATADRMLAIAFPDPEASAFTEGVAAGDATETAAVFWTRVPDAAAGATLEVAEDAAFASGLRTVAVPTPAPGDDRTVKVEVTGLAPATAYFYRFRQGAAVSRTGRVVTAPAPVEARPVRFGWSGDANAYHRPFTIADQLRLAELDAFLFIGDTIEAEDPRADGVLARTDAEYLTKHRTNRADGPLRHLLASTGTYVQWDDGEVALDFAGQLPVIAGRVASGNHAFRRYQPVRDDAGEPMRLYRSVRWGTAAELFILDPRLYRSLKYTCCNSEGFSGFVLDDTSDETTCISLDAQQDFVTPVCLAALAEPSRTILGAAQKAWLKAALLASTATFKLIVNGPPVAELVVNRYDRWEGYPTERKELLDFIQTNDLRNVIWLSTDQQGVLVSEVRVDATHRVPEVVSGALGDDSFLRGVFPSRLLALFEAEVIQSLPQVNHLTQWELDRPSVTLVTVDPTATPPVARFEFVDRTGVVMQRVEFVGQ